MPRTNIFGAAAAFLALSQAGAASAKMSSGGKTNLSKPAEAMRSSSLKRELAVTCTGCFRFGAACDANPTVAEIPLLPPGTPTFARQQVAGSTVAQGINLLPAGRLAAYTGAEAFFTFSITPELEGYDVIFTTCGGALWDTALRVFGSCPRAATSVEDLRPIAENDDAMTECQGTTQSYLRLTNLEQGTYYLAIDGYNAAGGPFTLFYETADPTGCRCGDFGAACAVRKGYVDLPFNAPARDALQQYFGTLATGASLVPSSSLGPEVIHRLTILPSDVGKTLELSTCMGATWDTVIRVYKECPRGTLPISALQQVAVSDDWGMPGFCQYQSRVFLQNVQAGELYVVVEGYGATEVGPYTLTYRLLQR